MSAKMRRYLSDYENQLYKQGYSEKELIASENRKNFFKENVLDVDTKLFPTNVEKEWSYIAKREYNYMVLLQSFGWGFFWGNVGTTLGIFIKKRMVFAPLVVITPIGFLYYKQIFFQIYNKRFFDMCNVGEEYELGKKRNEILRECNELLDVEDF